MQEEQAFCNFLQGGGWQGLYDVRTSSGACPVTAIERHPMILQPWSGVNLPRAFSTWKQTLELPLTWRVSQKAEVDSASLPVAQEINSSAAPSASLYVAPVL